MGPRDGFHKLFTKNSTIVSGRAESAPEARPAIVLLRAGAVPGGVAGGVVAVASTVVSPQAGLSALVGTVLAVAALAVGPGLMSFAANMPPPAVMSLALAGYGITVGLLAVIYVLLGKVTWLSGDHAGYAIAVAVTAWLVGQLRATMRLRILAFGTRPEGGTD